jgi:hypothetical protein
MCFTVHFDHQEALTATKNIVCYKTGLKKGSKFESYWNEHIYIKRKLQPHIELATNVLSIIHGYHSFTTKKRAVAQLAVAQLATTEILVKCVIPKGALYYYNPDANEYVSSTIIFKRFLKIAMLLNKIENYLKRK